MNFGTDVARRDGVAVLTPIGDFDMAAAPGFRQTLIKALADGDDLVVVNLSSVDFCDSAGLGALIGGLKRVRARGGDMVLCAMSPAVRGVFELCDLDRVYRLFETIDAAVAGVRPRCEP